jgi:hypothetical protein
VCRGYRLGDFSFEVCVVKRSVYALILLSIIYVFCKCLLIKYAALNSLYFVGLIVL